MTNFGRFIGPPAYITRVKKVTKTVITQTVECKALLKGLSIYSRTLLFTNVK
jgi:hypothetical protein